MARRIALVVSTVLVASVLAAVPAGAGGLMQTITGPTSAFTVSCSGLTCTFTNHSSPGTQPITSYEWDFGDGTYSSEINPTYTYGESREFLVSLTVRDDYPATSKSYRRVYPSSATANVPPTSQFTVTCSGLTCSFTNHSSDSDGTISSHQWSFGDGKTTSAHSPTHTYSAAGTFEVSLAVTDNAGEKKTSYRPVTVSAPPAGGDDGTVTNSAPTSQFTVSCSGLRCVFTNHSSDSDGTIASQQWKFGNGLTTSAHSPTHTYAKGGTYEVSLTVTDDSGAQATSYRPVTVTAPTTSTPVETVVQRAVALRSARHQKFKEGVFLVARGVIKIPSGVNKCGRALKVFIQKRTSAGWKSLEWNASQADGTYVVYVPAPHRSGKYRAFVKKTVLKDGTVCGRDASARLHHAH